MEEFYKIDKSLEALALRNNNKIESYKNSFLIL